MIHLLGGLALWGSVPPRQFGTQNPSHDYGHRFALSLGELLEGELLCGQ